jgi:sigma-B regulation protein RsbU (phosphoserine phosphatase)
MVDNHLDHKNVKKWVEYGAATFVRLVLHFVLFFSIANLLIYLFVPVDGAAIWVRQGPIKVLSTASIQAEGLREGDIILAIQDHDLDWWLAQGWRTLPDLIKRINTASPATQIAVERDVEAQTLIVPLSPRPAGLPARQLLAHFVVGLAFLASGWIIFKVRGQNVIGRSVALIMALMALIEQNEIPLVLGAELGWSLLWLFIPLRLLTRWFAYSYAFVFSLSFPQPKAWLRRRPYLTLPIHLLNPVVTLVIMFSVEGNLHYRHTVAYGWSKNIYIVYLLLTCIILVHTYFTTREVIPKNQLRWIAWGAVMAIVPNIVLVDVWYQLFGYRLLSNEFASLLLLFIPVAVAVAILRYHLWNIELIIKASLVYVTLTITLGAAYVVIVFFLISLLGRSNITGSETGNAGVFFVSALVVAFLFTPVRDHVQRLIDRLFYRNRLDYSNILNDMSRALATSLLINDWLQLLTRTIPEQLNLTGGRVILDALPPRNTLEYRRLKQGRLVWLHDLNEDKKVSPAPLDRLQQAGMWSCAPLLSGDELLGLYGLGPKRSGEYYNSEEIRLLETLARQAGVSLENAKLHEKMAIQVRIERDLEIARRIQLSLLPAQDPLIPGLDIVGFSMPSQEVGGDFYHYLKFDDKRVGIAVGDVSGKGVSAALFMAVSVSTLQAKSPHHLRVPELLAEMNNLLHVQMKGRMNTALRQRDQNCCQYVDVFGLPLGVMEDVKYRAYHLELHPGDLILLCSDGVVEAMNENGEMFGFGRLEQFITGCDNVPAAKVVEQLRQEITTFAGEAEQHDDITMVVVRVE